MKAVSIKVILGIQRLACHSSPILFPHGEAGAHRNQPLSKQTAIPTLDSIKPRGVSLSFLICCSHRETGVKLVDLPSPVG